MDSAVAVLLLVIHDLNWLLSTPYLMIYFPGLRFTGIFVIVLLFAFLFLSFQQVHPLEMQRKARFPASKLWLCTCGGCPRSSSSLVLCALLTNPSTRNCFFFIKGWSNKCPNSGSSMLNIFPWCLTNLEHSTAEIVLCHVNADSSGNVGTFFYVL